MTGRYKAYSEYKLSSNYALGYIPSHWDTSKVRYLSYCLDGKRIPLNGTERGEMQGLIPYWGANSVVDYIDEYIFDEDLILLGEDGAPFFDTTRNVAFFVQGKVWPNNHVHVLRPEISKVNAKFLTYALNCVDYHLYITGSTRDKLNQAAMNDIALRICSLQEQQKIANFLDHETAKIDTLIDKQEKLIELLKEKRQAVISHAVTKGLNPDAPMKNSGVEWLGEVPEHWEVTRAKFVSKIFVPQRNKPELNSNNIGTPWATMDDMKSDFILSTHHTVSDEALKSAGSKVLPKGSVIASCVGNFGVASINKIDVVINQQLQAYIPKRISSLYLRELVSISKCYFELVGTAATLVYVNQQGFENLPITLPSIEEQQDITDYLTAQKGKFDKLIVKCFNQVELMKERKTALISAAVTGKIDVRDWQPSPTKVS